jgi:transcriptional regulator with XRE-family HTH domain
MRPSAPRPFRVSALGPDNPERDGVLLAFGGNLRTLRAASGLSQERLAVRCFMRREYVSGLERGARAPDLVALLVLAHRLDVRVGDLIDGLPAPVRRVGTAQVLDLVNRQSGISTDALADSLGLPFWYACEIVLYLQSTGAVAPTRTGWELTG